MEFWEGAILVVGGIWLIGRVSRNSASYPSSTGGGGGPTPTATAGQIQRTNGIVLGESIGSPALPVPGNIHIPVKVPPQATHPNAMQLHANAARAYGRPVA